MTGYLTPRIAMEAEMNKRMMMTIVQVQMKQKV
jgi:hypothetical protein